ncbi:MAG: putative dTDPglucose 4,6-dehydratase [Ramlibacter sp.]|nr:putative dTDPglucose 4,6-dehydratase [Ramlibacter sp.]
MPTASPTAWSFERDLDAVVAACDEVWPALRGARLFITGGTGFIGCWLLETLTRANDRHGLGVQATVLSRNPAAFASKLPHLASHPVLSWHQGDVGSFEFPAGEFSHVIHGATDASADLNENNPLQMFDTVLDGTRRTLEFAAAKKAARTLFMSSGAVYGNQPWEMTNVPESYVGAPNCLDARATYAEAKRAAEMLCAIYAKQFGLQVAIARIFALLGPYLSLDIHFAAGNFIRDAMAGKEIVVKGNGLPERSYLYAGDLTVMLWHLLVRAPSLVPFNLGSDQSISVADLAKLTGRLIGNRPVTILGAADKGWNLGRYVPDTSRIRTQLGLARTVSLEESIRRTALWHGWKETQ